MKKINLLLFSMFIMTTSANAMEEVSNMKKKLVAERSDLADSIKTKKPVSFYPFVEIVVDSASDIEEVMPKAKRIQEIQEGLGSSTLPGEAFCCFRPCKEICVNPEKHDLILPENKNKVQLVVTTLFGKAYSEIPYSRENTYPFETLDMFKAELIATQVATESNK